MNKEVAVQRILRMLAVAGALVFIAVVLILQALQPEYDAIAQPMSELALGIHGQYMLLAFTALAMTVAAAAFMVRLYSPGLFWMLFVAAWCFLAAGLVTLQASIWIHLLCVGAAFVLCGSCMYFLPRYVYWSRTQAYLVSWGLLVWMALSIALVGSVLPAGIAQRLAALGLLIWLLWLVGCVRHLSGR